MLYKEIEMKPTYLVQLLWTLGTGMYIIDSRTVVIVKRWTKCQISVPTMREVLDCPLDGMAYSERARQKNCGESVSCEGEKLVYHCLLNVWRNATVEVCAPENLITGYYCPHYNIGAGRVLEDYRNRCKDCPYNYKSTSAYKYKSCYKISPKVFNKVKSTAAPCIKSKKKRTSHLRRKIDCPLFDSNKIHMETSTAAVSSSSIPSLTVTSQAVHTYHRSLTDDKNEEDGLTTTIYVIVGLVVIISVAILSLAVVCKHKAKKLPVVQPPKDYEKDTIKRIDEQEEFLKKQRPSQQNGAL